MARHRAFGQKRGESACRSTTELFSVLDNIVPPVLGAVKELILSKCRFMAICQPIFSVGRVILGQKL